MKTALVNLANSTFSWSQHKLNKSASKFGIDKLYSWQHADFLKTDFYLENQEILSKSKGLGYWLWKPYILLEAMKKLQDGDLIIYCDSGIEIVNNLDPLFTICNEKSDILCFNNCDYHNAIWTKRDCFVKMECDEEKYHTGLHIDAAFVMFKKSEKSIIFIEAWMKFGKDKYIITDEPNICGLPNFPEFRDHRWDQSILSLLAIKYDLDVFRCPTQFGNHYKSVDYRVKGEFNYQNHYIKSESYASDVYENSPYGTLLNHHRTKRKLNFLNKLIS